MSKKLSWGWGLLILGVINLFGLRFLSQDNTVWAGQENTDTRVMVATMVENLHPLNWLVGDWPLRNGFYRPLPSLAFWLDYSIWGNHIQRYVIFNWITCLLSMFALVWFVWELTKNRTWALASGGIFTLMQTDLLTGVPVFWIGMLGLVLGVALGFARKEQRKAWWLLALAWPYLAWELLTIPAESDMWGLPFGYRVMGWPPGRTAILLCLFSLLCLACYLRWENERQTGWLVGAMVAFVGAIMSYEQVVALAPCLVACAAWRRSSKQSASPWFALAACLLIVAYGLWHLRALPVQTDYHAQHSRAVSTAARDFIAWFLPSSKDLWTLPSWFDAETGLLGLVVTSTPVMTVLMVASNIAALIILRPHAKLALTALIMGGFALAPMVIAKPLLHYEYLPEAFRTLFVVLLTLCFVIRLRGLLPHTNLEVVSAPEALV